MGEDNQSVTQNILERMVRIETLIETKIDNTDKRVEKIEQNLQWLWRTIMGGFIATVMAFIFKK